MRNVVAVTALILLAVVVDCGGYRLLKDQGGSLYFGVDVDLLEGLVGRVRTQLGNPEAPVLTRL